MSEVRGGGEEKISESVQGKEGNGRATEEREWGKKGNGREEVSVMGRELREGEERRART